MANNYKPTNYVNKTATLLAKDKWRKYNNATYNRLDAANVKRYESVAYENNDLNKMIPFYLFD